MKKNIAMVIPGLWMLSSCVTEFSIVESDIPHVVKAAFDAQYPAAKDVKWEAEKEQGRLYFEAEFSLDGKEKEAVYRPDGSFVKEEND